MLNIGYKTLLKIFYGWVIVTTPVLVTLAHDTYVSVQYHSLRGQLNSLNAKLGEINNAGAFPGLPENATKIDSANAFQKYLASSVDITDKILDTYKEINQVNEPWVMSRTLPKPL